jgi:hypothetical protein
MDNYSKQIDINTIVINNVYKLITNKNVFLAKFVGRNKNEGLHFILESNKHTIVINASDILSIYEK